MEQILLRTALIRATVITTILGWCAAWYYLGSEETLKYFSVYLAGWVITAFASLLLAKIGIGRGSV